MENQQIPENVTLEDYEMPDDSSEDESSKSFEAPNASRAQKNDGAEPSEQPSEQPSERRCGYEFKRTLANLVSIPMEVFQMVNLRHLDLSNNSICFIPDDIQKLNFLQYLDLSHNNLTTLPNPLVQSSWLTNLNISYNNFTQVPMAIFKSVPCLKILDMSYNYISEFADPPLCEPYLEVLVLSANLLKSVPRWMFNLRNLRYIDIFNNSLTNVPSNFLQERVIVHLNRGIKCLNLQNCQITSEKLNFVSTVLDLETLALSNTSDVDAEHRNSMHYLNPSVISRLRSLKNLHASNVDMFFLHNNINSLQFLQRIDLSFNGLMWLPNSFCELVNLTECKLTSNAISHLPADFGKLINLKIIFLSENNLVKLPRSFVRLANLELCDLYGNQLETFDIRLMRLKFLRGLDLEKNCLNFDGLGWGEYLPVYHQRYTTLKENFRRELTLNRTTGQRWNENQRSSGQESPTSAPDFIASYPACQVFGLYSDTNLENWERAHANHPVHHDPEVNHPPLAPTRPTPRENSNACRYCHFFLPALRLRNVTTGLTPPQQQPQEPEPESELEVEDSEYDSD